MTSSRPPRLVAATTMVPVRPFITDLATRVSVDPRAGTITIERGSRTIVMRLGSLHARERGSAILLRAAPFFDDDAVYVPLAVVARALGEPVSWEPALRTVIVGNAELVPLTTMPPFDPRAPRVTPARIFTPEPIRSERPAPSGTPHPRRTPIPATPSWP